jgi:hypothetical protein
MCLFIPIRCWFFFWGGRFIRHISVQKTECCLYSLIYECLLLIVYLMPKVIWILFVIPVWYCLEDSKLVMLLDLE